MGSAMGMAHRWVDVGGLRLHCVQAGTGPLVVLLHGFPEFWYAWRHQLPALADAGYRVVAPDLPGYNTSDKPPRVRDYRPRALAQEVADLIAALGADSATVAGHDWGGGLAWLLAMHHPERVQRLVVLNAPHPIRFLKGLRSPRQLRRSWYMLAFQLPWLPERLVAASDFRALRRGPWAANRPGRAPSPPRTSTATSPRPPSPAPCGPPSTTTGPPSAPTRWPRRRPCVAWTSRPWSSGETRTATWAGSWPSRTMPGSRRCGSSGSPRPATGCRPTPPSGSTNSCWTSSSPSAAKPRSTDARIPSRLEPV